MRNEAELNVDATRHSIRAGERARANGKLHRVLDTSETFSSDSILAKLKRQFSPEVLDVAGRAVKGFVVPHWAAGVLLATILATGGYMYRSMSGQIEAQSKTINTQNELLIRMDQRFIDKEKHDAERIEDIQKRFQNDDAIHIVMNRDIQSLKLKAGVK